MTAVGFRPILTPSYLGSQCQLSNEGFFRVSFSETSADADTMTPLWVSYLSLTDHNATASYPINHVRVLETFELFLWVALKRKTKVQYAKPSILAGNCR